MSLEQWVKFGALSGLSRQQVIEEARKSQVAAENFVPRKKKADGSRAQSVGFSRWSELRYLLTTWLGQNQPRGLGGVQTCASMRNNQNKIKFGHRIWCCRKQPEKKT